MNEQKAFVEVGTDRVALKTVEGMLRRGADGTWVSRARSPRDTIEPHEFAGCRIVDDHSPEYWDLLNQAMRAFAGKSDR